MTLLRGPWGTHTRSPSYFSPSFFRRPDGVGGPPQSLPRRDRSSHPTGRFTGPLCSSSPKPSHGRVRYRGRGLVPVFVSPPFLHVCRSSVKKPLRPDPSLFLISLSTRIKDPTLLPYPSPLFSTTGVSSPDPVTLSPRTSLPPKISTHPRGVRVRPSSTPLLTLDVSTTGLPSGSPGQVTGEERRYLLPTVLTSRSPPNDRDDFQGLLPSEPLVFPTHHDPLPGVR